MNVRNSKGGMIIMSENASLYSNSNDYAHKHGISIVKFYKNKT